MISGSLYRHRHDQTPGFMPDVCDVSRNALVCYNTLRLMLSILLVIVDNEYYSMDRLIDDLALTVAA